MLRDDAYLGWDWELERASRKNDAMVIQDFPRIFQLSVMSDHVRAEDTKSNLSPKFVEQSGVQGDGWSPSFLYLKLIRYHM